MNKFNGNHLLFMLWGITGISLKAYPTIYTDLGGRDSWIAVACSSILLLLFAYILISISQKNNNFNICSIYQNALGKILGNIFIFFFILTLILTLIECSSVEANTLHINMLPHTPVWFFVLLFTIPAIYTILKGKNSLVVITIISVLSIIVCGIIIALMTQKYKNLDLLLPIMNNGITQNFFLCIVKSLGLYGCFSIIIPFLSETNDKKVIRKYILLGLTIIVIVHVLSIAGLIATFGSRRLTSIFYPKLIQMQLISYFGFIESGETYLLLQIVFGWYIKYILTFFSLILILKRINLTNNFTVYIISGLVIIFSVLISQNTFLLFRLLDYYSYFCVVNFILIPLIIYIIFNIRNKQNVGNI